MFKKLLKEHNKRLTVALKFYKEIDETQVKDYFHEVVRLNTVNILREMRYNKNDSLSQSACDNTLCEEQKLKQKSTSRVRKSKKS